jgi:hypothetical protein
VKINSWRFWVCCAAAVVVGTPLVGFILKIIGSYVPDQVGRLIRLGLGLIAGVVIFRLITRVITNPSFFRRFVGGAKPNSLATIRIITCTILLIMIILGIEDISSAALLPTEMRTPMGIMQFFDAIPGWESFISSPTSLQAFEWLTALILLLGIIGWQTRIVIPLGAVFYLVLSGILRHYTRFYHQNLIPIYLIATLSLTPCGDGFSVDRFWKIYRGQTVPATDKSSPIYGWSRYACWIVIALSYFVAGLSKLRNGGLFWWEPINMKYHIYSSALASRPFDWNPVVHLIHAPDILFALLGMVGLYGELAYGLVLFSKKARWIVPPLMGMIHVGIFIFQKVLFLDLIILPLIFWDFTKIQIIIENKIIKNINSKNEPLTQISVNRTISSIARKRYQRLIAVLVATLLSFWLSLIEFYPFTSWGMFSNKNTSGEVIYNGFVVYYESGMIEPAHPEKIIPALFTGGRYGRIISKCLSDELKEVVMCEKFLNTLGSIHNQKIQSGEKITAFEVQLWKWDFLNDASNFNYGNLKKRHIYEINNEN